MTGDREPAEGQDALPLVARRGGANGAVIFALVLALAAAALFYALEARRNTAAAPRADIPADLPGAAISSPPQLVVPALRPGDEAEGGFFVPMQMAGADEGIIVPPLERPRPARRVRPAEPDYDEDYRDEPDVRPAPQPGPTFRPVLSRPQSSTTTFDEPSSSDRKRLARFDNPSTTIAQGTVIHAVLESALDSTRPGAVRAIVSRDVSGFDGARVLIPKGSRLIGTYEADLARGQKRAMIQWNRLMLPSGMIMELDSPSADPLGRAGVEGKVNSHFFARFGGAILQSFLDAGVQVATRKVGGDTVVLNMPATAGETVTAADDIRPTLKVRHGTSISVFVAHDLDFSGGSG